MLIGVNQGVPAIFQDREDVGKMPWWVMAVEQTR
jgi:hypothetical protein